MTQAERPWWATEGDAAGPADDPLEAHRAARRGGAPEEDDVPEDDGTAGDAAAGADAGGPARDDGTWWVPATEAMTRLARDLAVSAADRAAGAGGGGGGPGTEDADGAPGPDVPPGQAGNGEPPGSNPHVDACGICPICVGLRAIGDVRPDLVVHLAEATRQLALAVRTVVDAAAPRADGADPDAPTTRGPSRHAGADEMHRIDLDD